MLITVFMKILVIFLLVAVGYISSKTGILPKESSPYLVNLMLDVTTPCMLLGVMNSNTLTESTKTQTFQVLGLSVVYFIAAAAVSWVIVKAMHYEPREDQGAMMVIITSMNTGFMGFPVTKAIFGSYFLYLITIENVILNIYLFVFSSLQMEIGSPKKKDIAPQHRLKSFCNLINLAVIIGLILLFTGTKLPSVLDEFITTLGDATVPISMIIVGMQLAERPLRSLFTNRKLVAACLCNLLLIPFLTFLAVNWLPVSAEVKVIMIWAACFPTAVAPAGIAAKIGKNANLLSEGVALSTALSMITLPIAATLLMSVYAL